MGGPDLRLYRASGASETFAAKTFAFLGVYLGV